MKLLAELPINREAEGRFTAFADDGTVVLGPVRCRGEADDAEEARHGTPDDDSIGVFGDHPFGESRLTAIEQNKQPMRSYGPFFFRLFPLSGEAKVGWEQGRRGLGLHSGELGPGGWLRCTYGCLRFDDETGERLAKLVAPELAAGRPVLYECRALEA